MVKTEIQIFVTGHRFHGDPFTKLTKKVRKGLISGRFNDVSSLVGNTRNKSASFSCLGIGTRPLFRGLQNLQKYSRKSLRIYS